MNSQFQDGIRSAIAHDAVVGCTLGEMSCKDTVEVSFYSGGHAARILAVTLTMVQCLLKRM